MSAITFIMASFGAALFIRAVYRFVYWLIETLEWINEERTSNSERRLDKMKMDDKLASLDMRLRSVAIEIDKHDGRIDRLNQEIEALQTALKSTQPKKAKSK